MPKSDTTIPSGERKPVSIIWDDDGATTAVRTTAYHVRYDTDDNTHFFMAYADIYYKADRRPDFMVIDGTVFAVTHTTRIGRGINRVVGAEMTRDNTKELDRRTDLAAMMVKRYAGLRIFTLLQERRDAFHVYQGG